VAFLIISTYLHTNAAVGIMKFGSGESSKSEVGRSHGYFKEYVHRRPALAPKTVSCKIIYSEIYIPGSPHF
jgi:hypothetical protein